MNKIALSIVVAAVFGLTACGGEGEHGGNAETSKAEPTKPQHRYTSIDGDEYLYESGVSENDRKDGKVMGDITPFKYKGVKDGKITLTSDDLTVTCEVDCKVITMTSSSGTKERIPYAEESVVGGAFSDAMRGLLVENPSKATTPTK